MLLTFSWHAIHSNRVRSFPSSWGPYLDRHHFGQDPARQCPSRCHHCYLDHLTPRLWRPFGKMHQNDARPIASSIKEGVWACIINIWSCIRRPVFVVRRRYVGWEKSTLCHMWWDYPPKKGLRIGGYKVSRDRFSALASIYSSRLFPGDATIVKTISIVSWLVISRVMYSFWTRYLQETGKLVYCFS